MPRATLSVESESFELKSCPGGVVELRRMSYGQYLERQAMAMEMQMTRGGEEGAKVDVAMAQAKVAAFEFRHCIVSHNLEDEYGNPLDFKLAGTLQVLDPRIGQEIGDLINDLNTFDVSLGK